METCLSDPSATSKTKVNTGNDEQLSVHTLTEQSSSGIDGCSNYIGDGLELNQSFSAELMPNKIDNDEADIPLTSRIGIEDTLSPGTHIVLSPASLISSPSSTDRGSPGWDSPLTPSSKSGQADPDLPTPLSQIGTSSITSKTVSFIDMEIQAIPADKTHADTKVRRNLFSDFQAIRKSVVNESSVITGKNVVTSPIKLESTSANANNNSENNSMELKIKIEVSQNTLGDNIAQGSLKGSDLTEQPATQANLFATTIDPDPPLATITKVDGHDSFQEVTAPPAWENETRKLFPDFTMGSENKIATSLLLDKQKISFGFSTSAQVSFGGIVFDDRNVVTVKSQVKTGSIDLGIRTAKGSRSVKAINGLKQVLKHIIPFEVRERLSDDEHRCIASYTNKPSRCMSNMHGQSSVTSARLASIVTSIKSHDYVGLPDLVEEFLAVAVCNRHRNTALSQSIKIPRMGILRDLVLSFPNVPEKNTRTFRDWLQAIVGHKMPALVAEAIHQPYQSTSTTGLSAILNQIMPEKAQDRFKERPDRCIVSGCRLSHARDAGYNPPDRRITIDRLTKHIAECAETSISPELTDHIGSLARTMMCCEHHESAMSKSKILKALISNLPHIPSHYFTTLGAWLRAITGCELPMLTQFPGTQALPSDIRSKVLVKTDGTSAVVGISAPSHSPRFDPYKAKWSSDESIAKQLRSKIIEPLSEADRKEGYVYIFWDRQHFGMVKIGRTDDLGRRLKEWSRQCKTTYHYHKSSQDGTLIKIPHIQRVERLIQIELVNRRRKRRCERCNKSHVEWFDIDEAKAVQVYQKWRDWTLKEPYAENDNGEWKIRPEMLDTLSQVCEPVILETKEEKRQQGRRKSASDVLKQRKVRRQTK